MDTKQHVTNNRIPIAIVAVVLLGAAGLAYSQGWFGSAMTGEEKMSEQDATSQPIEQNEVQTDR